MINSLRAGVLARHSETPEISSELQQAPIVLITRADPDTPTAATVQDTSRSFDVAADQLHPVGEVRPDEFAVVQDLVSRHIDWLHGQLIASQRNTEELRERVEQIEQRAAEAEQKIDAIRTYAIKARRRNDICRDGLDDFLQEFGLPPYRPEITAEVTVRARVTGYDVERPEQINGRVRSYLTVISDDEQELDIHSWEIVGVDPDTAEADAA